MFGKKDGFDLKAAVIAGAVAGAAYLVQTALEDKMLPARLDDRVLLGGQIVDDEATARKVGTVMHFGGSIVLGVVYARLFHDRLPGPPWLRGNVFINAENTLLYPMTGRKGSFKANDDGRLDPYWSWPAYIQSIPRHVVYGLVVGPLYERLRRT